MTREPDDFALKEQILNEFFTGWSAADAREAVEAIKLDAAEEAAARQPEPEPDGAWPPVWQPGDFPGPEPQPTPYDLSLTDDPQATWDDPNLAGPADRTASGPAPEPEAD